MKLQIVAVGRVKEKFVQQGIDEYCKRLQAYGRIAIHEVREESFQEPLSAKERERIQTVESERLLAAVPERSYSMVMDRRGREFTSKAWAKKLSTLAVHGRGDISLVLGGSLGLSAKILREADMVISFSKFTFPHQLMRLILCEQLYRAMTIIRGEKYHK